MNLYDIQMQLGAVLSQIEEAGGEITPDSEAALNALTMSRDEKLANICAAIKNWEAEAEAVKAEAARLRERGKAIEHRIDKLKEYTVRVLQEGEKWTNGIHRLSIRESTRVIVDPDAQVPEQYVRVEVIQEIDKKLIKTDLESGATLGFAHLETFKHLQVK